MGCQSQHQKQNQNQKQKQKQKQKQNKPHFSRQHIHRLFLLVRCMFCSISLKPSKN